MTAALEREFVHPEPLLLAEQFALQYLAHGRLEWDIPHTSAVVYYAKKLSSAAGADSLVITTAAILHDIGYFGLFDGSVAQEFDKVFDKKALHMVQGARLAKVFLTRPDVLDYYTPAQRRRIMHLVGVHDKMEQLKDLDEIILMEADTLGAIDHVKVTPTFNYESAMKYIEQMTSRRASRFRTPLGKSYLNELLSSFRQFYENGQRHW